MDRRPLKGPAQYPSTHGANHTIMDKHFGPAARVWSSDAYTPIPRSASLAPVAPVSCGASCSQAKPQSCSMDIKDETARCNTLRPAPTSGLLLNEAPQVIPPDIACIIQDLSPGLALQTSARITAPAATRKSTGRTNSLERMKRAGKMPTSEVTVSATANSSANTSSQRLGMISRAFLNMRRYVVNTQASSYGQLSFTGAQVLRARGAIQRSGSAASIPAHGAPSQAPPTDPQHTQASPKPQASPDCSTYPAPAQSLKAPTKHAHLATVSSKSIFQNPC